MSSLSEAAAKAAALAWVSRREHAGHTGPPPMDKWHRVWLFTPEKHHIVPQTEDLDLARGYVRLVRTLMGEKGDKVEVKYVGFE
jgi:hypothetical protein